VLVLDLRAHHEEWVRAKLGDRRLGFDDDELRRMLMAAGLEQVRAGVGASKAGDPFTVLIASGTKKGSATKTRKHENTPKTLKQVSCFRDFVAKGYR
jgi:hypothetical protein